MRSFTIHGVIADDDGMCVQYDDLDGRHLSAWPALAYRSSQPERIPVHWRHRGAELGEVIHLEHRNRHLHAVCVVDFDRAEVDTLDPNGPIFFSPTAAGARPDLVASDVTLEELSLTDSPASLGLTPVSILCGDVRSDADRAHWPLSTMTPLLANAIDTAAARRRYRGMPLQVRDLAFGRRPGGLGPMEHGPTGAILAVR
jgi:hypothetical protein